MFLNPAKVAAMNDEITALRANFTKSLRQLDLDEVYEDLFEIMWYSQLPCFDVSGITSSSGADEASLVKRCYWKGQKVRVAKDSRPGQLINTKIMVELKILVVILCHNHAVVVV